MFPAPSSITDSAYLRELRSKQLILQFAINARDAAQRQVDRLSREIALLEINNPRPRVGGGREA